MTKKAVAKKEAKSTEVAVATDTPEFMKGAAGKGTENLSSADVEIPRITLLHSLSREVMDGDEKPGVFYHTILEEAIGNKLRIVPVFVAIRYLLWRPRHEGGGILARADDGVHWDPPNQEFTVKPIKGSNETTIWRTSDTVDKSGLANWGSSQPKDPNSQPAATKMYNIVCMLPDHPELSPCVLTLQRGAVKIAKKFIGKLKMSGAPSYGQIFEMGVFKDENDDGETFFNFNFKKLGYVKDEEAFKSYEDMYEMFASEGVKIQGEEELQDEGGRSPSEEADDGEDPIGM